MVQFPENQAYRTHAIRCGINMAFKLAIDLNDLAAGAKGWLAHPVLHPETRETVLAIGMWVDQSDADWLIDIGLDYVIIEELVL